MKTVAASLSCFILQYLVSFAADAQVSLSITNTQTNPLRFGVTVQNTNRFVLEQSNDLINWRPHLNIFNQVSSFRFDDGSFSGAEPPFTFFRAAADPQDVAALKSSWDNLGYSRYQLRGMRECLCNGLRVSALVTVENGIVVKIEDPRLGSENGMPWPGAKIDDFRSVENMIDLIIQYVTRGDDLVVFEVASSLPFPSWTFLDSGIGSSDENYTYWIKDVVKL